MGSVVRETADRLQSGEGWVLKFGVFVKYAFFYMSYLVILYMELEGLMVIIGGFTSNYYTKLIKLLLTISLLIISNQFLIELIGGQSLNRT